VGEFEVAIPGGIWVAIGAPAYKKFLEVRRERIANRLNVFITG
jgi:hypothetical protein